MTTLSQSTSAIVELLFPIVTTFLSLLPCSVNSICLRKTTRMEEGKGTCSFLFISWGLPICFTCCQRHCSDTPVPRQAQCPLGAAAKTSWIFLTLANQHHHTSWNTPVSVSHHLLGGQYRSHSHEPPPLGPEILKSAIFSESALQLRGMSIQLPSFSQPRVDACCLLLLSHW